MFRSWFNKLVMRRMSRAARRARPVKYRSRLCLVSLEERAVPAVIAHADPAPGHEAAYLVAPGQTLHVAVADGVLANDEGTSLFVNDEDGSLENGIQVARVPSHGTLTMSADGSFTYVPAAGFFGTDSFTYRASDGTSLSDITAATLTVNTAPVANDQTFQTNEDTSFNGQLTASDAEGGSLTYTMIAGSATGASVTLNPNGSFAFTPNQDFNGPASFQFVVNDGTTVSAPATATVNVTAVNDPPSITAPATVNGFENADVAVRGISVSDVDLGTGNLSVTLTASNGTLSLSQTDGLSNVSGNGGAGVSFTGQLSAINAALNGLTFRPAANFTGPAAVGVSVNDMGNTGIPDPNAPSQVFKSVAVSVAGYPTITGVQVGSSLTRDTTQASRIDRIVVNFSDSLAVHPDSAFTLTRDGSVDVPVRVAWNATFTQATLTFSSPDGPRGSLPNGNYHLAINGSQLSTANGAAVDVNGTGQAGGVLTTNFYRLFGDVNGDRVVNGADFIAFRNAYGSSVGQAGYNAALDFDGDGIINGSDFNEFVVNYGVALNAPA